MRRRRQLGRRIRRRAVRACLDRPARPITTRPG